MTKFGMVLVSIVLIILAALAAGAYYFTKAQPVACTLEAKICPDGSTVGRSGPKCEFAECPALPEGTKSVNDAATGVQFLYRDLSTTYISATEWPPTVALFPQAFACDVNATSSWPGGSFEERTVSGQSFCVERASEGAAGSVFEQYSYATAAGDRTVALSFTLRFSQCANYDEPQQTECEAERSTFRPDALIAEILPTLRVP